MTMHDFDFWQEKCSIFSHFWITYQQLRRENTAHFAHLEQPKYQGLVLALIFGFPENQGEWHCKNVELFLWTKTRMITLTIRLGSPAMFVFVWLVWSLEFLFLFFRWFKHRYLYLSWHFDRFLFYNFVPWEFLKSKKLHENTHAK